MLELLDGAVEGEVAFPRCDETELGQPADFRRKRASLDAEVVRELLAVERNVFHFPGASAMLEEQHISQP